MNVTTEFVKEELERLKVHPQIKNELSERVYRGFCNRLDDLITVLDGSKNDLTFIGWCVFNPMNIPDISTIDSTENIGLWRKYNSKEWIEMRKLGYTEEKVSVKIRKIEDD